MSKESQTKSSDDFGLPNGILNDVERICKEKRLNRSQKMKLIDEIKNEYLKSSFEPGEAIGIISAQSISEPATQMCLDYNEKIIVKSKNKIDVVRIGDFVENTFEKSGYKKINGYDVCDLWEDKFVLSLNQKEKLEWKKTISCNRHESPTKLIKIKTKSGRKIVATDFHSFVTRKDNQVIPISGKELKVGDRIPVLKYLPESCLEYVNIREFLSNKTNPFMSSLHLGKSFGFFVGAYLSEGSCSNSQINISNINECFISNIKNFCNSINLSWKDHWYRGEFGPSRSLSINSSLFSRFVVSICGKGSNNKKVPEFAYSATEEFVSTLLRGYFDGDGSVSVSRKMIRVHSNSEELIDGIKLLLTRFGIFAYKHKEKKQFYLLIPYKYAPTFLSKISSDIEEKRKRLEKLSRLAKNFWKNKSQDFTDMISGFGDIFYRVAKKLKYHTRYVNNFTKRQKIGRTTLYRYIKLFEKLAKEKNIDIERELEILRRMFNSDVVWDEIIEITYVEPTSEYVYDISVPGLETFSTFDGIITHNTMRTFHFAGSVGVRVTLGLPRLIEIFDARKEPTTPMMTLYLKKKYNTKKDSEKIAEEIIEKKLRNFVETVSLDLTNKRMKIKLKTLKKRKRKDIVSVLTKKFKRYKIRAKKNVVTIESKEKELAVKDLQRIKKKILDSYVSGIQHVENTLVLKESNDWIIKTFGSNFLKILEFDEIDAMRSYTNNVHESAAVLGIEAARNAIIKETKATMQQQGLDVDDRHIILVADIMTFSGEIKAIGRYGVAGMKPSILTRAGFEETIKHLIRASVRQEEDNFDAIFDNVMVNQQVPIGTGMFELISKLGEE